MTMRTAVLLLLAAAGCARDPGLCCDEFGPGDDKGLYCNAHKDMVKEFVRGGRTPEEARGRLEWFRGVMKDLEPLQDSDEVHDRLSRFQKSRPEFWVVYEKHHFWAGRDTNLGLEKRGELMKCGFRHALYEMELEPGR